MEKPQAHYQNALACLVSLACVQGKVCVVHSSTRILNLPESGTRDLQTHLVDGSTLTQSPSHTHKHTGFEPMEACLLFFMYFISLFNARQSYIDCVSSNMHLFIDPGEGSQVGQRLVSECTTHWDCPEM